jgi:phenylacetate-CoA ligase
MLQPIGKGEIAKRFPEGVLTKEKFDKRSVQTTSGTTGDRLSVVTNFSKRETVRASTLYVLDLAINRSLGLALLDIPPNVCNTVCGLEGPPVTGWLELLTKGIKKKDLFKPSFRSDAHGLFERRVVLRQDILAPLDARSPSDLMVQLDATWHSLKNLRPELLRALPQYLLWIAQFALKTQSKPSGLKFAMPYGGLASGSLLSQVRESLGVQTRNSYGTSELGPIAVSCDEQTAMHLNEDFFELEIMRNGQMVNDGEVGEIVVTDFTNTAMPLIRYKIGDVGRFVTGQCRCGRTTRRIEVLGRLQETIQLEDQWITPASIAEVAYSDHGISNFRVDEIGSGQYDLQIVPSLNDRLPEVELLKKRFSDLFDRSIRLSHRIVPCIQPEPNGKFLTCRLRSFKRNG